MSMVKASTLQLDWKPLLIRAGSSSRTKSIVKLKARSKLLSRIAVSSRSRTSRGRFAFMRCVKWR